MKQEIDDKAMWAAFRQELALQGELHTVAAIDNALNNLGFTIKETNVIIPIPLKQGEQKPANKIEPIFNVGDKIQYSKGCDTIMTIEKIENGEYIFANNMGHTTIEWGNNWYLVEQKPAWSEEDERAIGIIKVALEHPYDMEGKWDRKFTLDWLKSLKDRVQPQSKQEWSEEDEAVLDALIRRLEGEDIHVSPLLAVKCLKSLRPQNHWKPSEEQMEALESAEENCAYSEYQDCLIELIGQLKKLREE